MVLPWRPLARTSSCIVFDPSLNLHLFAGTHRIQRVPSTEKNGRRHTSTITVAVIPEADETKVELDFSDLRIDVYKDSGPGGQNRNRVATAIRIVHLPTGLMVTATEERSQHQNKQVALKRMQEALSARLSAEYHESRNLARTQQMRPQIAFCWTDWRDEVKSSTGRKMSMKKALKGDMSRLLA